MTIELYTAERFFTLLPELTSMSSNTGVIDTIKFTIKSRVPMLVKTVFLSIVTIHSKLLLNFDNFDFVVTSQFPPYIACVVTFINILQLQTLIMNWDLIVQENGFNFCTLAFNAEYK